MAHPPRQRRRPGARPLTGALIPDGLDATLALVRHGESTWIVEGRFQGRGDPPLSERGERQAAAIAARLADPQRPPPLPVPDAMPLAVLHSPLQRTTTTAARIAAAVATAHHATLAPTPSDGLVEIGQGEWDGRPGTEVAERWGDVLAAWRRDPLTTWAPGGEALPEVDTRIREAVRPLLARLADVGTPGSLSRAQVLGYSDADEAIPWAVVVGHDGSLKVLLLALLDLPLARFWTFPFALAGVSIVEIRGGRARLRAHNLVDHLVGIEAGPTERPPGAL